MENSLIKTLSKNTVLKSLPVRSTYFVDSDSFISSGLVGWLSAYMDHAQHPPQKAPLEVLDYTWSLKISRHIGLYVSVCGYMWWQENEKWTMAVARLLWRRQCTPDLVTSETYKYFLACITLSFHISTLLSIELFC